jgi:carbonic anhydrase/acetyltransferase-like protein (isoleucine patch superfamily)
VTRDGQILRLGEACPVVAANAWLAPDAKVIGDVRIGARSSIWYGAVLRGDDEQIAVGAETNLQDGCVVHADPGTPVLLGDFVTVGHRAVLHGCTVHDRALIGMGAILLNGSVVGSQAQVAAGAVVTEGFAVPPGCLVAGVPARVRRELTDDETRAIESAAVHYVALSHRHAAAHVAERGSRA